MIGWSWLLKWNFFLIFKPFLLSQMFNILSYLLDFLFSVLYFLLELNKLQYVRREENLFIKKWGSFCELKRWFLSRFKMSILILKQQLFSEVFTLHQSLFDSPQLLLKLVLKLYVSVQHIEAFLAPFL